MTKRYNEFITIRCEEGLKKSFEKFCADCGMTVSGAVTMLVRNAIKEQRIPFAVDSSAPFSVCGFYDGGSKQSVAYNVRVDKKIRDEYKTVCEEEIGMGMSRLIKIFMLHCVKNGKLPFSGVVLDDEDEEDE